MSLWLVFLAGCAGPRAVDTQPPPERTVEAVVGRYNDNALRLKRVWATAAAFVEFRDPDSGKLRREQGDGNFIFIRPDRVTLTTGKLGRTLLWAGNNDRQFWLFDLQDDGVAYVGSYARLGEPGAQPLPLPVRPDRLPALLGLLPIDPQDAQTEWLGGDLLVEPKWSARRVLIDHRTGLARRVDLLDAEGRSVVVCELAGSKSVRLTDQQGATALPATLPAEAHVRVVGEEGGLVLKLANLTDDPDKFNEGLFDLDVLMKKHKPGRVVNLDSDEQR